MKKQISSIILATLMLGGLAGCSKEEGSSGNDASSNISDGTVTNSDSSGDVGNSSATSDNSSSETASSTSSDTSENAESVTYYAPDGSVLDFSEAQQSVDNSYILDIAYIRYAKPIFRTSFDEPDLYDYFQTEEFAAEKSTPIENPNYFKIKTGDKLENGFTVKSVNVRYNCIPEWTWRDDTTGTVVKVPYVDAVSLIRFEGEFTVEGIVSKAGEVGFWGDLILMVDTTKYEYLPVPWVGGIGGWQDYVMTNGDSLKNPEGFAYICDSSSIFVTCQSVAPEEILEDNDFVKVKMTLKDLNMGSPDGGEGWYIHRAELVSFEKI